MYHYEKVLKASDIVWFISTSAVIWSSVACVASVSTRVRRESWDDSKKKKKERTGEGEGREGNKVNFSNLVFYSLSILTSCHFTNEPNREISRGVFQNCGVCGQAFPLLPSPFHIFYFRSNVRTITRLGTLATHARSSVLISVT